MNAPWTDDDLDPEAARARALPAGDEIEDAVDRFTFGRDAFLLEQVKRNPDGSRRSHRYSRDLRAAMAMLTTWFAPFDCDYYSFTRTPQHDIPSMRVSVDAHWECTIEGTTWKGFEAQAAARRAAGEPLLRPQQARPGDPGYYLCEGEGETLPLAICRAMLQISGGTASDGD